MSDEYKEWLKYAENDILTAETMSKLLKPPIEIVCYHCQQAAEKILKAFLVLKEEPVAKTHDLVFLLGKCLKFDIDFEIIKKECISLTNYGVNTRYPNVIDLVESDMDIAIKEMKVIHDFVVSKFKHNEK